jgi:hypothetical protein
MRALGWIVFVGGAVMFVLGCITLLLQVLQWLRTLWGSGAPTNEWVSLKGFAAYFHDFPIGVLIALFGVGMINLGRKAIDR